MARKVRTQKLEDDDGFEEVETSQTGTRARMIDWLQCCKLPALFSLIGYFVIQGVVEKISAGSMPWSDPLGTSIAAILILLGPLALISQLLGFSFDESEDRLSYHLYVFRRNVQLSEIQDANCETTTKPAFHDINTVLGMLSGHQFKVGNTKRYVVNLSGAFGARRIIFHSKYKRDQFLSLLRAYAPQARITRWV